MLSRRSLTKIRAIVLMATLLLPTLAQPQVAEEELAATWRFGFDVGFAGSTLRHGGHDCSVDADVTGGVLGGVRIGHPVSPQFTVGLAGRHFGDSWAGDDWNLNAMLLTLTWQRPASGWFVRAGLGLGGGDFDPGGSDALLPLRDRLAWTVAVGYSWRLDDQLSVGLALENLMLDFDGHTEHELDTVGASGLSLQLEWRP